MWGTSLAEPTSPGEVACPAPAKWRSVRGRHQWRNVSASKFLFIHNYLGQEGVRLARSVGPGRLVDVPHAVNAGTAANWSAAVMIVRAECERRFLGAKPTERGTVQLSAWRA